MPLYGKRTRNRYSWRRDEYEGNKIDRMGRTFFLNREKGKYAYASSVGYGVNNSSALRMENGLDFPIRAWLHRRYEKTGKKLRYLDWGCLQGKGLEEIAFLFGSRIEAMGYDVVSDPAWTRSDLQYYHRDPWRFLRYVKDGSMDLITGHYSIGHFINEDGKPRAVEYLAKLSHKLRPGGMLVFNTQYTTEEQTTEWMNDVHAQLPGFRVRARKVENRHDWLTEKRLWNAQPYYGGYYHYIFTIERSPYSRALIQPRQKWLFPEADVRRIFYSPKSHKLKKKD